MATYRVLLKIIVSGLGDTNYEPDRSCTRMELFAPYHIDEALAQDRQTRSGEPRPTAARRARIIAYSLTRWCEKNARVHYSFWIRLSVRRSHAQFVRYRRRRRSSRLQTQVNDVSTREILLLFPKAIETTTRVNRIALKTSLFLLLYPRRKACWLFAW